MNKEKTTANKDDAAITRKTLEQSGAQYMIDAINNVDTIEVSDDPSNRLVKVAGLLFNPKTGEVWPARAADFAKNGEMLLKFPTEHLPLIKTAIADKQRKQAAEKHAERIEIMRSIIAEHIKSNGR